MAWTTDVQAPTSETKASSSNMKSLGLGAIFACLALVAGFIVIMVWMVRLKVQYPSITGSQMLTDKPRLDHRQYQWAKFSNGLEVLNIQDKGTQSSGFAIAVEAGSFYDPEELQGLAHFCEHMLFLGTDKYPEAGGFDFFLNMHGGASNAYTAQEATVYFASLNGEGMSEGMDRFADFFRAPLFKNKFVQKEVHAIDSEHAKNKQSPDWRVLQVMNSLANPKSPVGSFHTGNLETLYTKPKAQNIDIVDELKKYFDSNYCPPRMRFVTFGQTSVEEQQKEAFDKFASLSSSAACQATPPSFAKPKPFSKGHLGKFVHIKGTQPQGQLWVFFSFPDLRKEYDKGALEYLQHVLAYSGENSFSYALREDLGLIQGGLGISVDQTSAGSAFWLTFSLTSKGTAHPELVLDALLLYMKKMKDAGVDEDLYKSLAEVTKLMWTWSELAGSEDTVQDLAERMTRLPQEDLLKGGSVITMPSPTLVNKLMDGLVIGNMNVGFVDPNFTSKAKSPELQTLPYYGVEYTVEDLQSRLMMSGSSKFSTAQFLDKLQAVDPTAKHAPKVVLPKPIKHIPQDITLDFAKASPGNDDFTKLYGAKPEVVLNDGKKLMWFRQGSMSTSPEVSLSMLLRTESSKAETSARDNIIFSIFSDMFLEELRPKTADLTVTGTSYAINLSPKSLEFSFGGFKQNFPQIMHVVLKKFQHGVTHNAHRFHRVVQKLRETIEDKSSMPVDYAMKDLGLLLSKSIHSDAELLQALKSIKPKDVTTEVKQRLKNQTLQLTSFVMGNVDQAEAKKLHHKLEAGLAMETTLPISKVEILEPVVKAGRRVEIRKLNPRAKDSNHVTLVSILYGVPEIGETSIFSIVGQVLSPLVYEELRTKRQLGYVVQGDVSLTSNVLRASVVVQGDVMKPDEVEPLIDWILTKRVPEKLANMTDAEFQTYKESYINSVLEPPLGFSSEVNHYWPLAERGGVCPNRALEELTYVREKLKDKMQLSDAWHRLVLPGAESENHAELGTRSRMVVKYFAKSAFSDVPERPSEEKVRQALEDLELPPAAIDLAVLENKNALVLDQASSKERDMILALDGAGYYPAAYKCQQGPKVPGDIEASSMPGHASLIRNAKRHSNLRAA